MRLDRLVVTGSNTQRLDMDKVAPITVLDETAIDVRAALMPVDLLTSLPSVVNLPENETRLGSSGARGDNANLNLRNLGATATLILVNDRRMAINPMTAGLPQAVNVNQLPTVNIKADVVRVVGGFRDKLGGTWNWETSGFYNEVAGVDEAYPDVRESRLQQALRRTQVLPARAEAPRYGRNRRKVVGSGSILGYRIPLAGGREKPPPSFP